MKLALLLSILALGGCATDIHKPAAAAYEQKMSGLCHAYAEEQSAGYQNPDVTQLEYRRYFARCMRGPIR